MSKPFKVPTALRITAKSLQSCPTLCDPIDGSPPGSTIPGILQTRTLEWVAISFSSAWKWKVKVKSLSRVWLLATPWSTAYQAPPSMDFPGKSTGVGCHCLLPSVLSSIGYYFLLWYLVHTLGLWCFCHIHPAIIIHTLEFFSSTTQTKMTNT